MKDTNEIKKITIEVNPDHATIVLGLIRGFIPSMLKAMDVAEDKTGIDINLGPQVEEMMYEVVNEIYEKCIKETSIREGAQKLMDILNMTGQFPDKTEN